MRSKLLVLSTASGRAHSPPDKRVPHRLQGVDSVVVRPVHLDADPCRGVWQEDDVQREEAVHRQVL